MALTRLWLLQAMVTLHGLDANVQQAINMVQAACAEAKNSSREATMPLMAYQAALFTLPALKHVGQKLLQDVKKSYRVRCWLNEASQSGSAFNGIDVKASGKPCANHFAWQCCGGK